MLVTQFAACATFLAAQSQMSPSPLQDRVLGIAFTMLFILGAGAVSTGIVSAIARRRLRYLAWSLVALVVGWLEVLAAMLSGMGILPRD